MDYSATRFDLFCSMLSDLGTPLRSGMTLLDFGCGEGRLVQAALALGVDAYGCDLLELHYSKCRLKESARLRAIRNPYELPFNDDSIDVVLSDQVLEHVQNYPQVVAELHRVHAARRLLSACLSEHLHPSRATYLCAAGDGVQAALVVLALGTSRGAQ